MDRIKRAENGELPLICSRSLKTLTTCELLSYLNAIKQEAVPHWRLYVNRVRHGALEDLEREGAPSFGEAQKTLMSQLAKEIHRLASFSLTTICLEQGHSCQIEPRTWQMAIDQILSQNYFLQMLDTESDLINWTKVLKFHRATLNKGALLRRYQVLRHERKVMGAKLSADARRREASRWFANSFTPCYRLLDISYRQLEWRNHRGNRVETSRQLLHPRILQYLPNWDDWLALGHAFGACALREVFFYHFSQTPGDWVVPLPIQLYSSSSEEDDDEEEDGD